MAGNTPTVYLLHGEDAFSIEAFIQAVQAKMGSPTVAGINTTRVDGRRFSLGALDDTVRAVPFLAERRLVILHDAVGGLRKKAEREKFMAFLARVPASTALVLWEPGGLEKLKSWQKPPKDPKHWLLKWAKTQDFMFVRGFPLPARAQMPAWIKNYAKKQGGQFSQDAALTLTEFIGEDTRQAANEVEKLLTYVKLQRQVEMDDVMVLTVSVPQGDVFKMVDAIGQRNGQLALEMLHQLLADREPLSLLGMIVLLETYIKLLIIPRRRK